MRYTINGDCMFFIVLRMGDRNTATYGFTVNSNVIYNLVDTKVHIVVCIRRILSSIMGKHMHLHFHASKTTSPDMNMKAMIKVLEESSKLELEAHLKTLIILVQIFRLLVLPEAADYFFLIDPPVLLIKQVFNIKYKTHPEIEVALSLF